MRLKIKILAPFLFIFFATQMQATIADDANYSLMGAEPKEIVINNRILLRVNGKPITLMDVVKKMDFIFYRQYPQLASSMGARYQFYTVSWERMLSSLIDDHLILADAEEKKVEITDGDIREAMEDFFGPDVVINLDKMGLTYNEAWELLKTELTVQRMVQMMVRSVAQAEVHPQMIRKHYEKQLQENPPEKKWVYQTLTIEGKDENGVSLVAEKATRLLSEQKVPFGDLLPLLKEESALVDLRLSDEYNRTEKELSPAHRAMLQSLAIGKASSQVVSQSLTKGDSSLVRLFYLKGCEEGKAPLFNELAQKLSAALIEQATAKHSLAYSEKLRKYYGVTDEYIDLMIPKEYQPFSVR